MNETPHPRNTPETPDFAAALADLVQVTVVGPGLLGASVGLGLKQSGYAGRVVGVARSQDTLEQAEAVGAIDDGTDDLDAAVRVDGKCLIVVAVPLGRFGDVFKKLAPHQRRGMVVTDVGSTKLSVAAEAKRYLTQPQFFVPAHPMAGSEQQGPKHARADLFVGKPCVLCPTPDTDEDALERVRAVWGALGCRLLEMTAEQHDTQVAAVSHLPHLLAVLLAQTADDMGPLDLASTGFAGTSRLASSNPPMRADIIDANRQRIAEALDRFAARLNDLRGELRKNKHDALLERLEDAKQTRDAWVAQRDEETPS